MSSKNKLPLRIASLSFAVVVTGFLVARAAGCTSAKMEPVSPTSAPPPVMPTTPSDPSEAPGDAGPKAELMNINSPAFLPASKAAMPIMRPPEKNPEPAPTQQATP